MERRWEQPSSQVRKKSRQVSIVDVGAGRRSGGGAAVRSEFVVVSVSIARFTAETSHLEGF